MKHFISTLPTPVIVFLFCILALVIFYLFSVYSLHSQYADFSRFQTQDEVRDYLEQHLTVDQTTKSEALNFLASQGVTNCDEDEDNGITGRADTFVVCETLAPGGGWTLVCAWFYSLRFDFKDDKLINTFVLLRDLCL
jgi:hypothetical protein